MLFNHITFQHEVDGKIATEKTTITYHKCFTKIGAARVINSGRREYMLPPLKNLKIVKIETEYCPAAQAMW